MNALHRAAMLAALLFIGSAGAEEPRPNILFCFSDDWGRIASIYAEREARPSLHQVVKTPNVDRIAREGMLFRQAFVNAPSCTPSRSAILSGRYFFNTGQGAILQGAQWDAAIPSFPLLLRDANYHIGKSHKVWSPGTPADAPFGGQKFSYQKAGSLCNKYGSNVTRLMAEGFPQSAAHAKILDQVRGNFDQFVADAKPGQPWLYWFGPTNVHRAYQKGSGQALWKIDPDSLRGKLPAFLPDVPEVRADMADYLGEIQAFDAYIGALIERLQARGEYERTLIVLSGDHGPPGFTHGKCNLYDFGTGVTLAVRYPGGKPSRTIDDLVNLMDLCPTFLDVAGVPHPAGMSGRSLLPIFRSQAEGIVDPSRDATITGRERHVANARSGNLPYPSRALRTHDYLYIRNYHPDRWPNGQPERIAGPAAKGGESFEQNTFAGFADMDASPTKAWLVQHRDAPEGKKFYDLAFAKRPGEELYDVKNDPDQLVNLAEQPQHAATKKRLAELLERKLTELKDPRRIGAGTAFDQPPFAGEK